MAGPTDRFRQIISYAPLTGRDAYGKPTLGAVSTAPARVQPTTRTIKDATGADFVTSHVIYTAAPVTTKHRLWLPGDDPANFDRARRPARVDEEVDGVGTVRFRKVWL